MILLVKNCRRSGRFCSLDKDDLVVLVDTVLVDPVRVETTH